MMRKVLFVFSALLLMWGCSSSDDETVSPVQPQETQANDDAQENEEAAGVIQLSPAQRQAVTNNNDFAFNFFRAISSADENVGKGIVASPLSLTYALGMLNTGATGQTSSEITTMLGFANDGREDINALCQRLIEQAPAVDEAVTLRLADLVASDKSVALAAQYREEVAKSYQAEAVSLDFSSMASVKYINDWCSKQTEGMVPSIVESLADVKLTLLNAVYFNAPWSGKFDAALTGEETFYKEDGTQAMLPMMHRVGAAYLGTNDTYATLGLPYGNGKNWTMFVLLPKEGKSVDDVVASLNSSAWSENVKLSTIAAIDVDVALPRFKAETRLDLRNPLKRMGAPSMFAARGELSGLTEGGEDLSVSDVIQKSVICVTEEGTEASAVTVVYVYTSTGDGQQPVPTFHATRPFVYLVQENTSGAIFFIGSFRG